MPELHGLLERSGAGNGIINHLSRVLFLNSVQNRIMRAPAIWALKGFHRGLSMGILW
ncbi:hypothetical protein NOC27_48 [Nitrosococcus oceani AFC27]|nr:hypothetical protein NOC27_48 [Nitrosococcus oceani AFC27]